MRIFQTETILDTIFPSFCLGCGVSSEYSRLFMDGKFLWLCPDCFHRIEINSAFYCVFCNSRFLYSSESHRDCRRESLCNSTSVATFYNDSIIQALVHHLKYSGVRGIAEIFAAILTQHLVLQNFPFERFSLMPVPISRVRMRERGFNHAEEITAHLAAATGMSVIASALQRIRQTASQTSFAHDAERVKNVLGVFRCIAPEKIKGENILLIDDVMTTGATITECARALRAAKPKSIWAVAVAGRR